MLGLLTGVMRSPRGRGQLVTCRLVLVIPASLSIAAFSLNRHFWCPIPFPKTNAATEAVGNLTRPMSALAAGPKPAKSLPMEADRSIRRVEIDGEKGNFG